jgi:phosphoribosylanthranilate isomerase
MRTRIKVCGITNLDDALAAVDAGVDALGFVFVHESSRYVMPESAREIIRHLPPMVNMIGVFVDEKIEKVREIANHCSLDFLQFHGAESPEYCEWYTQRVIKAFRVKDISTIQEIYNYKVQGILLDSYSKEAYGGTGATFDWSLASQVAPYKPVILAGGLTPQNVGEAIVEVRPFAVDVSSGVEKSPGNKNPEKLGHFVRAVRHADRVLSGLEKER